MGRSRTDNQSAVSPARFRRRTRTAPAPDPTALFPSPFPADQSPDASATTPQSFSAGTDPADPPRAARPDTSGAAALSGSPGTNSGPAPHFPSAAAQPQFATEPVGGLGYGSRVNAPGDPKSATPHGSRAVPGAPTAYPPTQRLTARVASTTIPLTPVGSRPAPTPPQPDPAPASRGGQDTSAPDENTATTKLTKRLWRRKPATIDKAAGVEDSPVAPPDDYHDGPRSIAGTRDAIDQHGTAATGRASNRRGGGAAPRSDAVAGGDDSFVTRSDGVGGTAVPFAGAGSDESAHARGESDWRYASEAHGEAVWPGGSTSARGGMTYEQSSGVGRGRVDQPGVYPDIGYPPGYFDQQVDSAGGTGGRGAPPASPGDDASEARTARRSERRGRAASAGDGGVRNPSAHASWGGSGAWDPAGAHGIPEASGFGGADASATPHSGQASGGRETLSDRAGRVMREALAPTGVEPEELARRLPDTLRGMGEQALVAVRKWADPRERELRRRRRTRRRSLRLGTAGGVTTAGTVGLVLISAPAWAVIVVGGGAVALVTGTAVTAKKYLQMRKEPLPQAAFQPRRLPPLRSAARASIARLIRAERALHGLGAQIARSGRLPADDLNDTLETAASGSAALHALSDDLVAMERASEALGPRNSPLAIHVQAVAGRLDAGVLEFEGMVAAAARVLAVPESAAIADDLGFAMVNLRDAADRLDGWAQALTDLADERYRANP